MDAKLLPYLTDAERDWLALAEAATPGPWEPTMYSNDPTWSPVIKSAKSGLHLAYFPVGDGVRGNAAFIAASRTAVPAALEALALARRDAEKYRRVLEKIAWTIGAGDDGGLGWDQGTALREIARAALTVANTYDADHPADCAGPKETP